MSLEQIRSPHVLGSPTRHVSSSDHTEARASCRAGVTSTWVYETDDYNHKTGFQVLEVRGNGEPTMLIDEKGLGRLVRDRKGAAIHSGRKYVYLNSRKYHLGSNPFKTPLSKIFALYEQAVEEHQG